MPSPPPHPQLDRRLRRAWFWRWWSVFMLVFGVYALVLWLFTARDVPPIWWSIVGWIALPAVALGVVLWVGRGVWRTWRQRWWLAATFAFGWVAAAAFREVGVWWLTAGLAASSLVVALVRWTRKR